MPGPDLLPDAGEILWVDFGPPYGHEQAERRPGLVISPRSYNERSSHLIICPLTRNPTPWPFKIAIPKIGRLEGFVLVDQVRSIDRRLRMVRRRGERVPDTVLEEIRGRLVALLGIE